MGELMNDNKPERKVLRTLHAAIAGIEQIIHDLFTLSIWRLGLTVVSFVTTTYGLMLLYDTLGGSGHGKGSIGILRYLIPIAFSGALHASIYHVLTQWVATRRRKFIILAAFTQVLAILGSFGTHWVHMAAGDATTKAYVTVESAAEQGIRASAASYSAVAANMGALSEYSKAQALVEEKENGTSCGAAAGSGKGPRYQLRMADRATFTGFNSDVATRKEKVDKLVERVAALTAGSADEAMARVATLRSLVNEAKAEFDADPLLDQVRKAAETRIVLGKGPIPIASSKRGKKGEKAFTCYDAELERRLEAVLAAIKSVKPLPEVMVPDYRDPTTGVPFALQRLFRLVSTSFEIPRPSREKLTADRIHSLRAQTTTGTEQHLGDIVPLVVASGIELALAFLFYLSRNTFARHPGVDQIAAVVDRNDTPVFDRIWEALGGGQDPEAVYRALDVHSKYEGRHTWVFVPLYGENREARVLHRVMELMTEAGMARRVYTGRGFMARWYMRGWDPVRHNLMAKAAVRIYRLSATEYLAFILDALNRKNDRGQFLDLPTDESNSNSHPTGVNENEGSSEKEKPRVERVA